MKTLIEIKKVLRSRISDREKLSEINYLIGQLKCVRGCGRFERGGNRKGAHLCQICFEGE